MEMKCWFCPAWQSHATRCACQRWQDVNRHASYFRGRKKHFLCQAICEWSSWITGVLNIHHYKAKLTPRTDHALLYSHFILKSVRTVWLLETKSSNRYLPILGLRVSKEWSKMHSGTKDYKKSNVNMLLIVWILQWTKQCDQKEHTLHRCFRLLFMPETQVKFLFILYVERYVGKSAIGKSCDKVLFAHPLKQHE